MATEALALFLVQTQQAHHSTLQLQLEPLQPVLLKIFNLPLWIYFKRFLVESIKILWR